MDNLLSNENFKFYNTGTESAKQFLNLIKVYVVRFLDRSIKQAKFCFAFHIVKNMIRWTNRNSLIHVLIPIVLLNAIDTKIIGQRKSGHEKRDVE